MGLTIIPLDETSAAIVVTIFLVLLAYDGIKKICSWIARSYRNWKQRSEEKKYIQYSYNLSAFKRGDPSDIRGEWMMK